MARRVCPSNCGMDAVGPCNPSDCIFRVDVPDGNADWAKGAAYPNDETKLAEVVLKACHECVVAMRGDSRDVGLQACIDSRGCSHATSMAAAERITGRSASDD